MTETNATVAFPPGRYGRRRDPRRRRRYRWLPAALIAVVIVAGFAMAYQLNRQYGAARPYHPTVERFYDVTDEQVVVEFTVRVPDGEAATCAVRARAADGGEVGREEILVDPPDGVTRPRVTHRLATTGRPVTGEVQRCWRAD
jgi:Domain of unknown function (DUF4307)